MENYRPNYHIPQKGIFDKTKDYLKSIMFAIYSFIYLFFYTMFYGNSNGNRTNNQNRMSNSPGWGNNNSRPSGPPENCFRFRGMGGG
jgi:hypothetical protein